ncbi:Ig-like domain-containing protein [Nafulsella turpanensis]|uniref:Ig-like domain-containing protein n=1 Tax=Nafulsella turpanensis TaxID=1265690 RepID=UPI000348732B|nr:Ig-like domain-containing protein [Nafulsella turpanensis]
MRKRNYWIVIAGIYFFIQVFVTSCANISTPTGGPKDTIPPALVKVNPTGGAVHYNERIVRLEFNEAVQVKDLANQLIITPSIQGEYKTKINKNTVELLFQQPFDTNTTYTLSFREGISDLNEGNPVEDLQLAFSTGAFLDSMSISGTVQRLLTGEPVADALVGLYRAKDTLNIFNSRPYYLSKTDETGFFQFNNLKVGEYLLYATADANRNLKTEASNEPFGFIKDTIYLNSNIDSLNINLLSINTNPPAVNSARPSGPYFDIRLNKAVKDYELQPLEETEEPLYSNLVEENKTIRVYNAWPIQDSLATFLSLTDSLGQQLQDTVYVKFQESKREKGPFEYTVIPKSGAAVEKDFTATISFTKPVKEVNTDSLFIRYDSLTTVQIVPEKDFTWNSRRDRLEINKLLEPTKTIANQSSEKASLQEEIPVQPTATNGFSLHLGKAAFISAEQDSSKASELSYRWADAKNFGLLQGRFSSEADSFTIQLLDANTFKVVKEVENQHNFTFNYVAPGEYRIRVLIDENENGQWDPGNIYERIEPEPVILLDETISLKANWELKEIEVRE